jgi:hypothetical protein
MKTENLRFNVSKVLFLSGGVVFINPDVILYLDGFVKTLL